MEEGEISFMLLIVLVISLFLSDILSDWDEEPITKIFSGERCTIACMAKKWPKTKVWKLWNIYVSKKMFLYSPTV